MKKALIWLLLIAVLAAPGVFCDEISVMWSRMYVRAVTYEDKITLMRGLVQIDEPAVVPLFGTALQELIETRENIATVTERMQYTELAKLIARRLGELKAAEYSGLLFDVYKNSEDVYLRAEAILALGRTIDADYSDDVAILLRNLNLNIDLESEDKDAEVLALAAVLALERFRQPVGYTPLFFASIGWYSRVSSVREQAARVLDKLVDDPTGILHGLVRLETDYTVKFEALEAAGRSGAPAAAKAAVAAEAVRQGLVNVAASAVETSTLGRLRQRGLELLIEYGPADVGVTEYLEEIISGRLDINEQLTAVAALEADGRSEAVAVLVRFLKKQNERQLSGLSPADYRVVKSVIITLGEIGDPAAFEELTMVKISNWPAALVRDAQEALHKLK